MNKMGDILCEIPDSQLSELAAMYEKHIKWAPFVHSFIHTGIRWKNSEKYRNKITYMSPNNNWKKDGTIIVLMEFFCNDIFVFTLDETNDSLYKGLMETNKLNFHNILFFCLHEKFISTITRVMTEKNIAITMDLPCVMFAISSEEAKKFQLECPPEVYLKELDGSAAIKINSLWPHKYVDSEKYLEALLTMNGGVGLFLEATDELVAWAVVHSLGHLGMVQTDDHHKKKGYGSLVTKALSQKLANKGFYPFGTVLIKNEPSLKMFDKLGFQRIGFSTYIGSKNNFV